jgi:hypothetical protein
MIMVFYGLAAGRKNKIAAGVLATCGDGFGLNSIAAASARRPG